MTEKCSECRDLGWVFVLETMSMVRCSEKPKDEPKPAFDPDLSPENPQNKEAARARRLVYDRRARVYKDEDGCIIRDEFGQRL